MPVIRQIYLTCVVGNDELTSASIAIVRRAEPLITPFLELTDPEFICDWNGVRATVFMVSSPEPEPSSQDKGKASTSSPLTLKVPPLSPAAAHISDDDDEDIDKLLEPVKRRVKITAHNPIAPSSSQKSATGKKTAKTPIDHEPFDASKHQYWKVSVRFSS